MLQESKEPKASKRNILVTSALPYANGPIHLGHLLEYIQTDIWVRFQKLRGNTCHYVCADDAHGTAIMLKAEENKRSPEEQIANVKAAHEKSFAGFQVAFDNYYSTHSPENEALATDIYNKHHAQGIILSKNITQLFDPEKKMFLADRFVKGDCPKCSAEDQYGDNCEVCGSTYQASELKNPRSTLSGAAPIEKENEQLFFDLPQFTEFLKTWTTSGSLQPEIANKLKEWLDDGLQPWDISREAPYFGFKIPGYDSKYFYVWLDAPIGYMASFKNLCDKQNINFDEYWGKDSSAELYHFIGKDIINFHGLFWPAMLSAADYRLPNGVFCHGFLTVDGKKMSKSRGTFIMADTYLEHLKPEYLRYYFAAKLNSNVEDIDLNLEDFRQRVNSDLVGKFINIASRTAGFIKKFGGTLADKVDNPELLAEAQQAAQSIETHYESREYGKAMREIMLIADKTNAYIADKAPWALAKQEGTEQEVLEICTLAINVFKLITLYLKPVLPELAEQVEAFLQIEPLTWDDATNSLLGHDIVKFKPLLQRIDEDAVSAMVDASKSSIPEPEQDNKAKKQKKNPSDKSSNQGSADDNEFISFDDFCKVELRVAKITEAEAIEGADKLLRLTVSLGELGTRNVIAGIKAHYSPDDLIGRLTVVVANLAPRKMKFGISEAMVLAASGSKSGLYILNPDDGSEEGMLIR